MRSYAVFSEAVGKFARYAFDHATRVHEDQSGAMVFDELRQAVIDLIPNVCRHDRFQRRGRQFELKVALAVVPAIDNQAIGSRVVR